MIKIDKFKNLILITSIAIIFTGCASVKMSPEEIVSVPKLSEGDRRIQELVARNIPSNAKLESVNSPEGLSSVKMIDIDGDGTEEIIVTYALDTDESPLHLLIFRKNNDSYSFMSDIPVRGTEFDRIDMKDVTSNNKKDLIVTSVENNSKILTIYSFKDDIKKIFEIGYNSYAMQDIDGNGTMDIVIFKSTSDLLTADFYMYDTKAEKVNYINETVNYLKIDLIHPPIVDYIEKNKKGIILQGNDRYSQTRYTLVYGINKEGKIENLMKDVTEEGANIVGLISSEHKSFHVHDVDNDGIVEIPRPCLMVEEEGKIPATADSNVVCAEWLKFIDNKFVENIRNIYIEGNRVYFSHPENWPKSSVTGSIENTKNGREFVFTKKTKDDRKQVIMTIVKTDKNLDKNYRLIREDGDEKYYIKVEKSIPDELKSFSVEEEKIVKSFKIDKYKE